MGGEVSAWIGLVWDGMGLGVRGPERGEEKGVMVLRVERTK